VTKVDGNAILGLAGRPALDVLREVAEELPEGERTAIRDGLLIGSAVDEYRDRFGRGDFLLRPIVGADLKRKAVLVGDHLRPGRTVRFHVRDRATATEDLELLLDLEQMRDPPLAAFVATCGGRGRRLFGKPDADAKAFARRLGDPPLAGLFAAGEIGPVGSRGGRSTRSWLHGHTVCAALFRPEVAGRADPAP
jgi:small ligand-binding sensory domain FIST